MPPRPGPGGRNGGGRETKAGPGGATTGPGTGNKAAGPREAAGRSGGASRGLLHRDRGPTDPPPTGGVGRPRPGPAWGVGTQRGHIYGGGGRFVVLVVFGWFVCCWFFFFPPLFAESKELNPVPRKFGGLISENDVPGAEGNSALGNKTHFGENKPLLRPREERSGGSGDRARAGPRTGTSPSSPQPGPRFYRHHHGYYFKFGRVGNQTTRCSISPNNGGIKRPIAAVFKSLFTRTL